MYNSIIREHTWELYVVFVDSYADRVEVGDIHLFTLFDVSRIDILKLRLDTLELLVQVILQQILQLILLSLKLEIQM